MQGPESGRGWQMRCEPWTRLHRTWAIRNAPTPWLTRATHGVLAGIPTTFGLSLLRPGETFRASPNFRMFEVYGTENHWGAALLAVGALGLLGMASSRWLPRIVSLAMLGTVHWGVALLFILSNPFSTGTWTYDWVALLAWFLVWENRHGAD